MTHANEVMNKKNKDAIRVGKAIVSIIFRAYSYTALFMFFSGVVAGALWALTGHDDNLLLMYLR